MTTNDKLFEAWAYCDMKDKSTEFMLEYMQDVSGLDMDDVLDFITNNSEKRQDWYERNPNWWKKYE